MVKTASKKRRFSETGLGSAPRENELGMAPSRRASDAGVRFKDPLVAGIYRGGKRSYTRRTKTGLEEARKRPSSETRLLSTPTPSPSLSVEPLPTTHADSQGTPSIPSFSFPYRGPLPPPPPMDPNSEIFMSAYSQVERSERSTVVPIIERYEGDTQSSQGVEYLPPASSQHGALSVWATPTFNSAASANGLGPDALGSTDHIPSQHDSYNYTRAPAHFSFPPSTFGDGAGAAFHTSQRHPEPFTLAHSSINSPPPYLRDCLANDVSRPHSYNNLPSVAVEMQGHESYLQATTGANLGSWRQNPARGSSPDNNLNMSVSAWRTCMSSCAGADAHAHPFASSSSSLAGALQDRRQEPHSADGEPRPTNRGHCVDPAFQAHAFTSSSGAPAMSADGTYCFGAVNSYNDGGASSHEADVVNHNVAGDIDYAQSALYELPPNSQSYTQ